MATFIGYVRGQRGAASRLGHTHITTTAASWKGAVVVELSSRGDKIWVNVMATRWHGSGENQTIYSGPLNATILPAGIRTELEIHSKSK